LKVVPRAEPTEERVLEKALEQDECNVNAGMPQVIQIIGAPLVYDITVVVVAPAIWPSYIEPEPIAAVMEAVIPTYHLGAHHVERVATAKMLTVIGLRNAAITAAVVATVVSNGLSAL
jgi:hypothetical protein